MRRPLVFISYSRDAYAKSPRYRELMDAVLERLDRTFEVFKDERAITPSDDWEREIGLHLARCRAAIVLLAPEAIQSRYVRHECTILHDRKMVRSPGLRIVPVTVDVAVDETYDVFPPHGLSPYSMIDAAGALDEIVDTIASAVGSADQWMDPPPVEGWIDAMATSLGQIPPTVLDNLDRAGAAMHDGCDDWSTARRIARRMLVADRAHLQTMGPKLGSVLSHVPHTIRRISKLVRPLWLSADYVQMLPSVWEERPGCVVMARLSKARAGADYVQRAWLIEECHRLVEGCDATHPDDGQVIADLIEQMLKTLGSSLANVLADEYGDAWFDRLGEEEVFDTACAAINGRLVRLNRPVALVLPPGYGRRPELVRELARLFGRLSILVLERDDGLRTTLAEAVLTLEDQIVATLEPELSVAAEKDGLMWALELADDISAASEP